ncbi:bacillithiol system redox-active protein YtxJ [Cytobacillus sp. IB215665]|uniref:bacillithiol system redox-active protein YtxJ n=1 Tax=Cytobacillus sp. IB215665 TaxID=3097357 RepID=UPI002A135963|nr:bacillithiol system redox-active protein YtxJ [Cytobacillus sp. IB215665]MDX8367492.1 bacillithiol system redox-active protein YtxJ [Cytobacillus sp. IB215665]
MAKVKISSKEQFEKLINEHSKFLIMKHSLTCPISSSAFKEFEKYNNENEELQIFYLYVQESRALSNFIAEKYSTKHESPQVLLVQDGKVIWHTSHWNITYDTLKKQVG